MNAHSRVDRRGPLDLDSTQTVRALSESELYDSHQPRWYAVQLVVSDRAINLDMMPRLDAFSAHQLYALAAKHETGTWHALRLGFFPDEQSAETVCEHLQTYFSAATTVRVSVAEQTRFAQRTRAPAPAPKPLVPGEKAGRYSAAQHDAAVLSSATLSPPAPRKKTLAQELLEEAREVQLSRSGRKRAPEQSSSWITRLFGRPSERPRSTGRR
jgi:hypothetical protein